MCNIHLDSYKRNEARNRCEYESIGVHIKGYRHIKSEGSKILACIFRFMIRRWLQVFPIRPEGVSIEIKETIWR